VAGAWDSAGAAMACERSEPDSALDRVLVALRHVDEVELPGQHPAERRLVADRELELTARCPLRPLLVDRSLFVRIHGGQSDLLRRDLATVVGVPAHGVDDHLQT